MDLSSIRLAPMTREMFHAFYKEYDNDPALLLEGQSYVPYVYAEEKVDRYIQRQKDQGRIALAVLCGAQIAGEIIIKNIEAHKCATMSIVLKNDSFKGRGIGTEAEKLAVAYVFSELDVPTLYADAVKTNARSRHVLEKVGFSFIKEEDGFAYYRIDRREK